MILNGPGDFGPWPQCNAVLQRAGWSSRKRTDLQRFAEGMREGDLIVLRSGTQGVLDVGEVRGDYAWSDAFGDVGGWSLQHLRRVRWPWQDRTSTKTFDVHPLKFGDTTQALGSGPVREWLARLDVPVAARGGRRLREFAPGVTGSAPSPVGPGPPSRMPGYGPPGTDPVPAHDKTPLSPRPGSPSALGRRADGSGLGAHRARSG